MNNIHTMLHRLHNPDLGILFIRIALGVVFINAGWFKINDMDMIVGYFGTMGIPSMLAYLVAYTEFIGGILMLLGIFVRCAGIGLSLVMLVAIWKVHLVNGFSLANNGYEYVLVLLLGSLAMVTLGSGAYSLARFLRNSK